MRKDSRLNNTEADQKQLKEFFLKLVEHCEAFEKALSKVEDENYRLQERVSNLEATLRFLTLKEKKRTDSIGAPAPTRPIQVPVVASRPPSLLHQTRLPPPPIDWSSLPSSQGYWRSLPSSQGYSEDDLQSVSSPRSSITTFSFPPLTNSTPLRLPPWPVDTSIPPPPTPTVRLQYRR